MDTKPAVYHREIREELIAIGDAKGLMRKLTANILFDSMPVKLRHAVTFLSAHKSSPLPHVMDRS